MTNPITLPGILAGVLLSLTVQFAIAGCPGTGACSLSPDHSIINAGQTVQLTALCGAPVTNIAWSLTSNAGTNAVTSPATLANVNIAACEPITLTTPADLPSGDNVYSLTVNGTLAQGGAGYTGGTTSNDAHVLLQNAALNVTVAGSGRGTVTSNPGSFSCSTASCLTSSFSNSSTVSLTATANSTSTFSGWSGDCTGMGACSVTMNTNRNVTANFSDAPINGACNTTTTGTAQTGQPSSTQSCTSGNYQAGTTGSTAVTWTCQGINPGAQNASCSAPRAFSITPTAGANGSITPSSMQTVAYNVPVSFTARGTGSYTPTFSTGGTACPGTANGNTFTTGTLTSNCTVNANFSINPVNGACNTTTVASMLTAQPSTNQCSSGTYVAGTNTTSTVPWTCTGANGGTTANCSAVHGYTVTPSAGSGGSISPSSPQVVAFNATKSFTVTPNGGNTATVGGSCGGSMSGTTYTTSAIVNDCTVSASFSPAAASTSDPGLWTGLWIPPRTSNVIVADQPGTRGTGAVDYLPGCLNQGVSVVVNGAGDCSSKANYTGTVYGTGNSASVTLGNGQVMSIRFMSSADAASNVGVWSLVGAAGGNIGFTTSMWLSTEPGAALSSVAGNCQITGGGSIKIGTGPGYCSVTNSTLYYLNISVPGPCANCAVKLYENRYFQ